MRVGGKHSYQIGDKNKVEQGRERRGEERVEVSGRSACSHAPTQLSEVLLDPTPGVLGDEGLDHAPRLLLVLDVGVDPGGGEARDKVHTDGRKK